MDNQLTLNILKSTPQKKWLSSRCLQRHSLAMWLNLGRHEVREMMKHGQKVVILPTKKWEDGDLTDKNLGKIEDSANPKVAHRGRFHQAN